METEETIVKNDTAIWPLIIEAVVQQHNNEAFAMMVFTTIFYCNFIDSHRRQSFLFIRVI